MTLLGGAGTYLVLGDRLAVFTERWPLVIGLLLMAFVLFLPKGIWGTLVDKLSGGGAFHAPWVHIMGDN